jgi:hypothetical protein
MEKDFDRWNGIKKATDAADETARLYFREGEIWWVRLTKKRESADRRQEPRIHPSRHPSQKINHHLPMIYMPIWFCVMAFRQPCRESVGAVAF